MNVEGGVGVASPNEGGPSQVVLAKPSLTYIDQELWNETEQSQVHVRKALAKHPDALTSLTDLMMTHIDHKGWKEVKQLVAHSYRSSHQPPRTIFKQ